MARRALRENKFFLVSILKSVAEGREIVSRNVLYDLEKRGYLGRETIETGRPGRPPIRFVLTGRSRSLVAFSKNWRRSPDRVAA